MIILLQHANCGLGTHVGPEDIPLGDPNIPEDVRRWLRDYKEHVDLKEHTTRLRADITEEPWAEAPLLEKLLQGLPHAVSRKMTLQSQGGAELITGQGSHCHTTL